MTDLSKQQLILLALFVSFVTSLATGIVTVSLMDQAPQGVVQTITEVVDKTIQEAAAPAENATASASTAAAPADALAAGVASISRSIVRLRNADSPTATALGLVVSDSGVILADKSSVAALAGYTAVLPDGTALPLSIIQSEIDGDIVFLASAATPIATTSSASPVFAPVAFGVIPHLGDSVYALAGTSTPVLQQGIVTSYIPASSSDPSSLGVIATSIPAAEMVLGSPLFTADGSVIGMHTASVPQASGAAFYSTAGLSSVIPVLQ